MRRFMNFIVSVGLICAGAYIVYGEVFFELSGMGSKVLAAGLILIAGGVAWLWFDFPGPIILMKILKARKQPPDRHYLI